MSASPIRGLRRPWHPEPASEAAAAWVLLQEDGELSEANRRRFADWLAEDEAHVLAYEDALWALDAAARHAGDPEIQALRREALMARGNRRRLWGWASGAGVAVAALAAVVLWSAPQQQGVPVGTATRVAETSVDPRTSNYQTGIGQRSAISLPDGSVATLDTDSQIRVAYSEKERAVYLLKGQALFEVAHGKPMPFQVYARGQRITAVGTVFNVRIEGDEVRVSMVEGSRSGRTTRPPSRPRAGSTRALRTERNCCGALQGARQADAGGWARRPDRRATPAPTQSEEWALCVDREQPRILARAMA